MAAEPPGVRQRAAPDLVRTVPRRGAGTPDEPVPERLTRPSATRPIDDLRFHLSVEWGRSQIETKPTEGCLVSENGDRQHGGNGGLVSAVRGALEQFAGL